MVEAVLTEITLRHEEHEIEREMWLRLAEL